MALPKVKAIDDVTIESTMGDEFLPIFSAYSAEYTPTMPLSGSSRITWGDTIALDCDRVIVSIEYGSTSDTIDPETVVTSAVEYELSDPYGFTYFEHNRSEGYNSAGGDPLCETIGGGLVLGLHNPGLMMLDTQDDSIYNVHPDVSEELLEYSNSYKNCAVFALEDTPLIRDSGALIGIRNDLGIVEWTVVRTPYPTGKLYGESSSITNDYVYLSNVDIIVKYDKLHLDPEEDYFFMGNSYDVIDFEVDLDDYEMIIAVNKYDYGLRKTIYRFVIYSTSGSFRRDVDLSQFYAESEFTEITYIDQVVRTDKYAIALVGQIGFYFSYFIFFDLKSFEYVGFVRITNGSYIRRIASDENNLLFVQRNTPDGYTDLRAVVLGTPCVSPPKPEEPWVAPKHDIGCPVPERSWNTNMSPLNYIFDPYKIPKVWIRYWTDNIDIVNPYVTRVVGLDQDENESQNIYIFDNEDGSYDFVSFEELGFLGISKYMEIESYMEFESLSLTNDNTILNVTKIEVLAGSTLKKFYDDRTNTGTFAGHSVVDIIWNGDMTATSFSKMFMGCNYLENVNIESFNTENGLSFEYMFAYCSALVSNNFSSFKTSSATNMRYMFRDAYAVSQIDSLDLAIFDMSNVNNIYGMFMGAGPNTVITGNWNLSSVTDLSYFMDSSYIENFDISGWTCSPSSLDRFASESHVKSLNFSNMNFYRLSTMRYIAYNSKLETIAFPYMYYHINMYYAFAYANNLRCVHAIDSRRATSRYLMFNQNYALTSPNSAKQVDLMDYNGAIHYSYGCV